MDTQDKVDGNLSEAVNILINLNNNTKNDPDLSDEENDSGWDTDLGSDGSSF